VEVSSNGIDFVRFPSTSEIPLAPQLWNGSVSDCRMVNNLAGKYRVNYGTPFDLNELAGSPNLDLQNISFVRLIDVVGDVDGPHTSFDDSGNAINDPFPTEFHSGGFDLDAVGILNGVLGLKDETLLQLSVYPNPANGVVTINSDNTGVLVITDLNGKILKEIQHNKLSQINLDQFQKGVYLLQLNVKGEVKVERLIVE
jgi:hypothetical protein